MNTYDITEFSVLSDGWPENYDQETLSVTKEERA